MATGYSLTKISGCTGSTKTAIQKYKELPGFLKYFLANRPQRVAVYEQLGFVYCDQLNDWYIQIDGSIYLGKELTEIEWNDPYRYLGDRNPNNDQRAIDNAGAVSNGPYQIRYDQVLNFYYYVNEIGQRVYIGSNTVNQFGANPQIETIVIPRILENPGEFDNPSAGELYDPFENVLDILKNPIIAKSPVAGLYETKEYLDTVRKKRDQYRKINRREQVQELYRERVQDIASQQAKLVRQINEVEKLTSGLGAITPIVSVALNFLAPGSGRIASSTVQSIAQVAETKKDNVKLKNLAEDFLYMEKEREAIEKQVLSSSDAGSTQNKTIQYAIIAILAFVIGYVIIKKKWLR